MRDDLFGALSAVHDDPEVRAMVLCGRGPAFSTGGDVSEFGTAPSPTVARWVRFRRDVWGRLRALRSRPSPRFMAMRSAAASRCCCCATSRSQPTIRRFCLPETGLGMIPGVAGTQTASRRLGAGWALDLCITGRWIDAKQALAIGLVAEVVPAATLTRAAGTLAPRWAACLASRSRWRSSRFGTAWTCRLAKGWRWSGGSPAGSKISRREKRTRRSCPPPRGRAALEETEYREYRQFHQHPRRRCSRPGNPGLRRSQAHLRALNELVGRLSSSFKTARVEAARRRRSARHQLR